MAMRKGLAVNVGVAGISKESVGVAMGGVCLESIDADMKNWK